MNKKMIRRGIAGGVCVAVLAAAGFAVYSKGADKSESQETVQSANAEKGSISTTVVGTGTLENGTATDVVVPTGVKVKEVLVSSGDVVTEGQVLATLDEASIASELLKVKGNIETVEDEIDNLSDEADEEGTTEYLEAKVLNGKLSDLTEAETALESLMDSQAITATCAGTISSVNVQADTEVTKSSESSTSGSGSSATGNSNTNTVASADTTTSDSSDSTVIKTAASTGTSTSASVATMTAKKSTSTSASVAAMTAKKSTSTSASAATITASTGTASSSTTGLTYLTADTSTVASVNADTSEDYGIDFLSEDGTEAENIITISECNVEVEAPMTGNEPQTEIAETDQYTGTISWNLSTDKFQSGTSYTADIRLTAKDGYVFSDSILPVVKGADVTSQVVESDAGESILQIKAKFSKTASGSGSTSDSGTSGSAAAGAASSGVSAITGSAGSQNGTSGSGAASGASGSSASGNVSGVSGGGSTGASGSASTASSSSASSGTTESSDYSLYETAAFSIASATEASVSINVDELDILSVKEGQTATVTLDALDGQEFEGTITEVSNEASSGNSSAKYPVTITFEKTEDMLIGMSASATIHVNEAEDAVLIPVDALQEKGSSTFVYTKKDSDGNLSGEVEVETGISNGSQVEITSGLEEGDTVYYLKAESSDSSSGSNMPGGMDGQGGGMPDMNGGEAPSGGQAPSGGGPGGDGNAPSK